MRSEAKQWIIGQVRAVFNDQARGERPVQRREDGLFGPGSVAWRVHGDLTSMMVGGVAALLLQMLYPPVLAGVWDHSNFRNDMLGRLRRTARFIALTTYGGRDEAERAIARVREIHRHVHGTLPDGTTYSAEDAGLLEWVHATESACFLEAWKRYGEPDMSLADQDRYFAEVAVVAQKLGAADVPTTRAGLYDYIDGMRPVLGADERTREMVGLLLNPPARSLATLPVQRLTFRAAVDLLPAWARQMHGLSSPTLARPLVRAGTMGVAETLRWAFRPAR